MGSWVAARGTCRVVDQGAPSRSRSMVKLIVIGSVWVSEYLMAGGWSMVK